MPRAARDPFPAVLATAVRSALALPAATPAARGSARLWAAAAGLALGVAWFGPRASAQNALGDGRALDNSLSAQGRYNQARPDFAQELRFRNAIVTGNAPNGLSFRGDVGYTAPGDFRASLGSNDLFAFRRDSLVSGLAGAGIRGTDALQYQAALTTGSRPPQGLIGGFYVPQSGAGASGFSVTSGPTGALTGLQQRSATDPEADRRGSLLWSLRSPSAYVANRDLNPTLIGTASGGRGGAGVTASALRGVRLAPLADLASQPAAQDEDPNATFNTDPALNPAASAGPTGAGLTGAGLTGAGGPLSAGRVDPGRAAGAGGATGGGGGTEPLVGGGGEFGSTRQGTGRAPTAIDPGRLSNAAASTNLPAAGPRSAYEQLRERQRAALAGAGVTATGTTTTGAANPGTATDPAAAAGAGPVSANEAWRQRVAALREQLAGEQRADEAAAGGATGADAGAGAGEAQGGAEGSAEGGDASRGSGGARGAGGLTFDARTLRVLRESGEPLTELVPGLVAGDPAGRDVYHEHMRTGQRLLADGRYFDAEERFTTALAARPADVAAQMGRLHAQLGGGMFLSATINLRQLLLDHPEVAAARYGPGLLPSAERVESLLEQLRGVTPGAGGATGGGAEASPRVRREAGLLLAYLSRQVNRRDLVEAGLSSFAAAAAGDPAAADGGPSSDARLAALLRELWLNEAAPTNPASGPQDVPQEKQTAPAGEGG